jgi:hypothetical protein
MLTPRGVVINIKPVTENTSLQKGEVPTHTKIYGRVEVKLQLFLALALEEVSGQLHSLAATPRTQ